MAKVVRFTQSLVGPAVAHHAGDVASLADATADAYAAAGICDLVTIDDAPATLKGLEAALKAGDVVLDLPTSDPAAAGQVWNDGGALAVSAG